MTKRLVDIDDEVLHAARDALGTATIKATIESALLRAADRDPDRLSRALDTLATMPSFDRNEPWR